MYFKNCSQVVESYITYLTLDIVDIVRIKLM